MATLGSSMNKEKARFDAAVRVIQTIPKDASSLNPGAFQPSHELMLKFYSFYKQATIGPCNIAKPAFYDVVNRAKWGAWKSLGDMDAEVAMQSYVEELKKIIEAMPHTHLVADFMDEIGTFYELVEEDSPFHKKTVSNGDVKKSSDSFLLNYTQKSALSKQDLSTPLNGHLNDHNFEKDTSSNSQNRSNHEGILSSDMDFSQSSNITSLLHTCTHVQVQGMSDNADEEEEEEEEFLDSSDTPENTQDFSGILETRNEQISSNPSIHRPPTTSSQTGSGAAGSNTDNTLTGQGRSLSSRSGAAGGSGPPDDPRILHHHNDAVSQQINTALLRLQADVNNVLQRLNTLESLTLSQRSITRSRENSDSERQNESNRKGASPWWWPQSYLPSNNLALMILWPIVVQLFFHFCRRKRLKKR